MLQVSLMILVHIFISVYVCECSIIIVIIVCEKRVMITLSRYADDFHSCFVVFLLQRK